MSSKLDILAGPNDTPHVKQPCHDDEGGYTCGREIVASSWNRTFVLHMLVYAAVVVPALSFLKAHPDTPWKIPIAVAPAVPLAFLVLASVRHTRRLDEFQQRKMLEVLAFAYPTMLVGSITYGFLEHAGFAQPNWMFVGVWMFALVGVGQILAWWRYR